MDPTVRDERVATSPGVVEQPGTTPLVGTRQPVAPAAAPVAGAGVYTSRVAVYPVGYRLIQLVWLIAGVIDLILALDFVFRAIPANNTGFAHYIYRLGGWLGSPFDGIFNTTVANRGLSVFRWADVLAVLIYAVAAWIVVKLVRITASPRTSAPPL
jgi:hypothetical protein